MHKIRALGRRLTGRPRMIVYLVIAGLTCWSAAAGAAYYFMGWADKYFVGTIFADIKEGSNTGGTYGEYNGPDKAWATIGIQTRAGQANAVSRASFYIRDRSTTKCGTLHAARSMSCSHAITCTMLDRSSQRDRPVQCSNPTTT